MLMCEKPRNPQATRVGTGLLHDPLRAPHAARGFEVAVREALAAAQQSLRRGALAASSHPIPRLLAVQSV